MKQTILKERRWLILFDYEFQIPPQMKIIEMALRTWGGWNRMFAKSAITWDKENITYRQRDGGFWNEWSKIRSFEYFEEEVEICYREVMAEYGKPKDREDLKRRIRKALLGNGWKPPKTKIIREARALRKLYKEQIASLKKLKEKRYGKEDEKECWFGKDRKSGKWSHEEKSEEYGFKKPSRNQVSRQFGDEEKDT